MKEPGDAGAGGSPRGAGGADGAGSPHAGGHGRIPHAVGDAEAGFPQEAGEAPAGAGRKLGLARLRLAVLAVVTLLVLGTGFLWAITPPANLLQPRVENLVHRDGAVLLQPGEVPPLLAEAVVSIEDERFYQHHGIDVIGMARAALFDVSHHCLCQGGSTITEQLVKDVFLNGNDRGPQKLADMMLAVKIELVYNKQQILADYLSEVPVGGGRHGMPAAACAYFGRPLDQLTLGEDALLAGLPQAPSLYDPRLHPRAAALRRRVVLAAMQEGGYITTAQEAAAAASPVVQASSRAGAECGTGPSAAPLGPSAGPSATRIPPGAPSSALPGDPSGASSALPSPLSAHRPEPRRILLASHA